MMKKILSLLLACLMAFSVLTVAASAADTIPMEVYDLLKHDVDSNAGICRTISIYFRNQLVNYDSTKQIAFLNEDGTVAAVCKPHAENNRILDLYTPDGSTFGVKFNPTRLYYLNVEEGAYCTVDGIPNAAYKGEYNGVVLTSADKKYTIRDLGIQNFIATKYDDTHVYAGKLLISSAFTDYLPGNNSVTLYKVDGSKITEVGTYHFTGYKNGMADIDFGADGTEINKFDSYKLRVKYGSFIGKDLICDHSEFALSGKRLLNQREDYPVIDFLMELFGKDHKIISFIPKILNVLATIKLIDKALSKDIEKYIKAKQAA